MKKKSIKNKILAFFICFMALLIIGQTVFYLCFYKTYFIREKSNVMLDAFSKIKDNYPESSDDLNKVEKIVTKIQDTNGVKTTIFVRGEAIYVSGYSGYRANMPYIDGRKHPFQLDDFKETPVVEELDIRNKEFGALQLRGKFDINGENIYIIMSSPISAIDNSIYLFIKSNVIISIVILIIGIIVAHIISKGLSEPVISIMKISKSLSTLDFTQKANENTDTKELSDLAVSVNVMSDKLKSTIEDLKVANEKLQEDINAQKRLEKLRKEFIANVSHEMKTPLTYLQLYGENLKNNLEGIDKDFYCDTIIEETKNLNDMVKSMLTISSIENGFLKMNFTTINLSELCKDMCNKFEPLLVNFDFEKNIEEGIYVKGDSEHLMSAMKNYLSNACEHTTDGKKISVTLKKIDNNSVEYRVMNEGNQIKEEDLIYLWDAFYKADKARTRNQNNNVGLGLHIVKTIIEKHNGSYLVKNEKNGVSFSFILYI